MKQTLSIIIFGSCLLAGCKKKDPPYYAIADQSLRDAVNIHFGSYFVYYDSPDNISDTFHVDGFSHGDRYNSGYCTGTFETMGFFCTSSRDEHYGVAAGGCDITDKIGASGRIDGNDWIALRFFFFPFTEHTSINTPSGIVYELGRHYQNYPVSGKNYEDVYEVTTHGLQSDFQSFFSMRNGLVKFILKRQGTERIFELIDSKILR